MVGGNGMGGRKVRGRGIFEKRSSSAGVVGMWEGGDEEVGVVLSLTSALAGMEMVGSVWWLTVWGGSAPIFWSSVLDRG